MKAFDHLFRTSIYSTGGAALILAAGLALAPSAGAAVYIWNVPGGNWSTATNWNQNTPGAGPQIGDTVNFCAPGDTTTSPNTINNTVDQNFTISNLNFTNIATSATYNVTAIPTGNTLTVTNDLKVGQGNYSNGQITYAYVTGGGTLIVTGGYVDIWNAGSASGAGANSYLNLSQLTNFVFNPTGGTGGGILGINDNDGVTREGGNLTLAYGSNYINAYLNLGTSTAAQAGPAGATLTLGAGTNIIYSGGIVISSEKCSFTMQANGGGLLMAGSSGASSRTPITIADGNPGGGTTSITGQMLLDGCDVNILAGTIIVSEAPSETGSGSAIGNFNFDTGTVSATALVMADNTSGGGTGGATGTVQVGPGATLNVGSGGISLATRTSGSGPATGTLIISNGIVNCSGPVNGGTNGAVSTITFVNGGTLSVGAASGALAPVGTLNIATNTTLGFSVPSSTQTNLIVGTVNWPSPDTGMTIAVTALPAGINPGVVFPLLTTTNFVGTLVSPILTLPLGVQGSLSQVTQGTTNTIFVTITGGVGPGTGGVGQLLNPDFAFAPLGTGWTPSGGASVVSTNSTYPNTSDCTHDTRNIVPFVGTNVAKLTGSFVAGGSTNTWSQSVALAAGSTITAGAFTYVPYEDMMSGADSFYYEVDFVGATGNLVAAYESTVVSDLTCGETTPFALDTWNLMAVTNKMQVVGGVNTGVIVSSVTSSILAPPGTVTSVFKAVFIQHNATDTGSAYFSGANLGLISTPVPPSLSAVTPNSITLCTNQYLSCTVTSTITTISSVKLTATTTTLAGTSTNTTVYTTDSSGFTITGLGTSLASISLALATNTIYQSVVIVATDADNLAVSSSAVSFDTLVPTLVIEGSDFNFTSNGISGLFFDTPSDGGLALYTNQVGLQGIDENKITRTNTQSYYRPNDATVIQAANPSPSGTEQKFVTAAASGDTRDIEVAIAYDTVGDWQNYSRTFGTSGTYSAQPGTYNVWCYLATSGSGSQIAFSQVTNNPAEAGQMTNFIGYFGGSTFSDNSFVNYVYAPLVDQFGNRVTLTVGSGLQTFRAQIASSDTPNVGFYMLVPVAPVYTPVFLNAYPDSTFQPTDEFTFSVGPAQGASISTNDIGLTINGVTITSGLSYSAISGGGWTGAYGIQSNAVYSVVIDVTNANGLTAVYTNNFDTFNINNFHWMAVDYDFSTNNGSSSGGGVGDGWTGGLFINNPMPTGATNADLGNQTWQYTTNSYFGWPMGFSPIDVDPNYMGAVAQESIDINWETNTTQDPGLVITNSLYRFSSNFPINDGVGSQIASDSFLLPEFIAARTNVLYGSDGNQGGPLASICEFNIGYFYTNDWLNYTRDYPSGTFNVWGRLAAGSGAFSGCTLSMVAGGVGTSNQTTQVLGSFSDPNPAGWQTYHWIEMVDTNSNPVYLQLSGLATLRLTAPTNATPGGNGLNPLFFMLCPAVQAASPFNISALLSGNNLQIAIPTQSGHSYTLWHSAGLTGGWIQVGGTIAGNGSVQTVNESVSGGQGYYKVVAQ